MQSVERAYACERAAVVKLTGIEYVCCKHISYGV